MVLEKIKNNLESHGIALGALIGAIFTLGANVNNIFVNKLTLIIPSNANQDFHRFFTFLTGIICSIWIYKYIVEKKPQKSIKVYFVIGIFALLLTPIYLFTTNRYIWNDARYHKSNEFEIISCYPKKEFYYPDKSENFYKNKDAYKRYVTDIKKDALSLKEEMKKAEDKTDKTEFFDLRKKFLSKEQYWKDLSKLWDEFNGDHTKFLKSPDSSPARVYNFTDQKEAECTATIILIINQMILLGLLFFCLGLISLFLRKQQKVDLSKPNA